MRPLVCCLGMLACAFELSAQVADSAAAARAHYRAAVVSLRQGDTTAALTSLSQAAVAWPPQGFYHFAEARLAAVSGRSDQAIRALKRLVSLGYGWDKTDPAATALAAAPGYASLERAMLAATAPLRRAAPLVELTDTLLHPEGLAWDGARRRWLVSSVRQRKIVVVDPTTRVTRDLVRSGQDGLDAALAIGIDSARGLVWVASAALPQQQGWVEADSGRSALFAFDLGTGKLRRRVSLPPAAGGHSLGDLTVAQDGTVYTSDTRSPAIYLARPGADTAHTVVAGNPLIRSPQGIVFDGSRLLVADYSHGIESVDLATGTVQALGAPPDATLLGIDGLVREDRTHLIGVQNGIAPARIIRLTLSDDGSAITTLVPIDRYLPEASEPTQGVIVGRGYVYLANSPWSNYGDDGTPLPQAAWPAPLLLRLPLE